MTKSYISKCKNIDIVRKTTFFFFFNGLVFLLLPNFLISFVYILNTYTHNRNLFSRLEISLFIYLYI